MTKRAECILRNIYDAWRDQDLDQVASLLPDEFSHTIHIPSELHPLGGTCNGKRGSMLRLSLIAAEFDVLKFDTSRLMFGSNHAAVEIPMRYRHRRSGAQLEAVFVNFWTFKADRPVLLTEYHDIGRIQSFVAEMSSRLTPI